MVAAHLAGRLGAVAGLRVQLAGADIVYPSHVASYKRADGRGLRSPRPVAN